MSIDPTRERRIVDLAIKLDSGDVTPEERRQAADALSFTAGERLGLEYRSRELERRSQDLEGRLAFVTRVLRIFWAEDMPDMLFWRVDDNEPSFYVFCSDTFAWASADVEQITPDNVELLERTIADVKAVAAGDTSVIMWAFFLFCARVRGIRIMPKIVLPAVLQDMFDACGPVRTSNDCLVG